MNLHYKMLRLVISFLIPLVAAQLGEIIQYEAMRFSECQDFVLTCPPATASKFNFCSIQEPSVQNSFRSSTACASIACQQCYSLGDATFQSCCGQPTPSYCFSTEYDSPNNGGGGNPYLTTTAIDPNLSACQTAVTIL